MNDAQTGATVDATEPFRFAYLPGTISYGEGAVAGLGDELARGGRERALVVTGTSVGARDEVMDPIEDGLGDRLADVFAETTSDKRLSTVVAGAEAALAADADAIVGVGGGSSLDVARAVAAVVGLARADAIDADDGGEGGDAADDDADATPSVDHAALADHLAGVGSLPVVAGTPPVVAVPTTLAGAGNSQVGGIAAVPTDSPVEQLVTGSVDDPELLPVVTCYDPALVATTPEAVLAKSAFNGLHKGVETVYSRHGTAITDGTATRGLSLMANGLAALGGLDAADEGAAAEAVDGGSAIARAVAGLALVEYGVFQPDAVTLGPLHALAKPLAEQLGCSQGLAHAVLGPHVLRDVFEQVDGDRATLARALTPATEGIPTDDAARAELIVDRLAAVRDALDLPDAISGIAGVDSDAEAAPLTAMAERAHGHPFHSNGPADYDPDVEALAAVLSSAW